MRLRHKYLPVGLLIVVITAGLYSMIPSQDFVNWDDNSHMRVIWKPSLQKAWIILTDFDRKITKEHYYAPLYHLSHMLDQALFGTSDRPRPAPAKLTNLLLHAINSALVFYLLSSLGIARKWAFAGALIFAAHPIQVGTTRPGSLKERTCFPLFSTYRPFLSFCKL